MPWEYSLNLAHVAFKCREQNCLSTHVLILSIFWFTSYFFFFCLSEKAFYSVFALKLWFQEIIIHTEYNEYIKGEVSLWRACVFLIIYQAPVSCDLGLITSCERQLVMVEYWCPAEKLSLSLFHFLSASLLLFISRLFCFLSMFPLSFIWSQVFHVPIIRHQVVQDVKILHFQFLLHWLLIIFVFVHFSPPDYL